MEQDGNEFSFTWDSTRKADGKHEIVVIAIGMDGEEAKADIMIETDNEITTDAPLPTSGVQEPAFFIPGFSLLEALMALSALGLLLAARKKLLR